VLNTLTNDTYASESVNDMDKVALQPLDIFSAKEMTQYNLNQEGLNEVDDDVIESIASQCDCIPFYIEKLIRRLSINEQQLMIENVNQEIAAILTDERDDWELEHFRKRLRTYYKGEVIDANQKEIQRATIAKLILNHCAVAAVPQSIDECNQAVKSNYSIDDRDLIITILNNLVKDHYLQRDVKGRYQFYFSLVQRWWVLAEGLNSEQGIDNA